MGNPVYSYTTMFLSSVLTWFLSLDFTFSRMTLNASALYSVVPLLLWHQLARSHRMKLWFRPSRRNKLVSPVWHQGKYADAHRGRAGSLKGNMGLQGGRDWQEGCG